MVVRVILLLGFMLDTNILLDFLSIQAKEDKGQRIPASLKRSRELKQKYASHAFTNYASEWNLLEFRDVVEKLTEEKKLIECGYSISEFSEGRKELPLTNDEVEKVQAIVVDMCSFSTVVTKEIDLRFLRGLCNRGFSTFDALLLLQAHLIEGCGYFVTRDARLRDTFDKKLAGTLTGVKIIDRPKALALL